MRQLVWFVFLFVLFVAVLSSGASAELGICYSARQSNNQNVYCTPFPIEKNLCCPADSSGHYSSGSTLPKTQAECQSNFFVVGASSSGEVSQCSGQQKCCVLGTAPYCTEQMTPAQCQNSKGLFFSAACSARPECQQGCCCRSIALGNAVGITQKQCSVQQGTFHGGITSQQTCEQACGGTPSCSSLGKGSCLSVGSQQCLCGTRLAGSNNPFCCAQTGNVFSEENACKTDCQLVTTFTIGGLVKDARTNTPLEGVRVSIGSISVTSGSAGGFSIAGLASGQNIVTAFRSGYQQFTATIQVTANRDDFVILLTPLDQCVPVSESSSRCNDARDNDCDNRIDCADSDCASSPFCAPPTASCGDGFRQAGESCDGTDVGSCSRGCDMAASPDADRCGCIEYCGDGIVSPINDFGQQEDCDDGNQNNADGCRNDCTSPARCGNGILETENAETCEYGADQILNTPDDQLFGCSGGSSASCTSQCKCSISTTGCGNGNIEAGEQCDGTLASGAWTSVSGCSGGALCNLPGTLNQCTCASLPRCGDNSLNPLTEDCDGTYTAGAKNFSALTSNSGCGVGLCSIPGSPTQCTCVESCQAQSPLLLGVASVPDTPNVRVTWSRVCANQFFVKRCEGDSCTPTAIISTVKLEVGAEQQYLDSSIKPDTMYCYQVDSVYLSKTRSSAIRCVKTGDARCFGQKSGRFCSRNSVVDCDANNTLLVVDECSTKQPASGGGSFACLDVDNNADGRADEGKCVYQSECMVCGSPFSMFPFQSFTEWQNPTLNENLRPYACIDVDSCYKDATKTVVDQFFSCNATVSCYDYRSRDACEKSDQRDSCQKFNCSWNPVYDDLGVGVCAPSVEEDQDCSKCNDPAFNEIFGTCTKDSCSKFGACYFDDVSPHDGQYNPSLCKHKREISCEDYDLLEDCTGGAGLNSSVDAIVDFSVDTVGQRVGGTHRFYQRSDDYFEYGGCKWFGGATQCIKDTNNATRQGSDCSVTDKVCQRDFTPPNTTFEVLALYGRNFRLNFSVADNVNLPQEIKTFYYLANWSSPQFVYPTYGGELLGGGISFMKNESGTYTLFFYSEDVSHNLELVRNASFFVDGENPSVEFRNYTVSYEIQSGQFLSNLWVNMTVRDPPFENVTCDAGLYKDEQPVEGSPSAVNRTLKLYPFYFQNLPDGLYQFVYSCEDLVGNINSGFAEIRLDGSRNLFDPLPQGTINDNSPIPLNISSAANASCRFSNSTTTFSSMIPFAWTGGQQHETEISVQSPVGIFSYDVRCRFTDDSLSQGRDVIYGNDGDKISFVVDTLGPFVDLLEGQNPYNLSRDFYHPTGPELDLVCEDVQIVAPVTLARREFGCDKIYFCIGSSCAPQLRTDAVADSHRTTLHVGPFRSTTNISYFGEDRGGNRGPMRTHTIQIDSERVTFDIRIIDALGRVVNVTRVGSYDVNISSSKPLLGPPNLSYVAIDESLGGIITGVDGGAVNLYNESLFVGKLRIPPDDARYRDIEKPAVFKIRAVDFHSIPNVDQIGSILFGGQFLIDTKPPSPLTIEPPVNNPNPFSTLRFVRPEIQFDGRTVYFTNRTALHISGFSQELDLVIQYLFGRTSPTALLPQKNFTQKVTTQLGESRLLTSSDSGGDAVYFADDLSATSSFRVGNYLKFERDFRRQYPFYKQYYNITLVQYDAVFDRTVIKLSPALEFSVLAGDLVTVVDRPMASNWFTEFYNLTALNGKSYVQLAARDQVGNPTKSEVFEVFYDALSPQIIATEPRAGYTINTPQPNFTVTVLEYPFGAGLNNQTIKLVVDGVVLIDGSAGDVPRTLLGGAGEMSRFSVASPIEFADGIHHFFFEVYDRAENLVQVEFDFKIDRNVAGEPLFGIDSARLDDDGRLYSREGSIRNMSFNYTDLQAVNLSRLTIKNANLSFEVLDEELFYAGFNTIDGYLSTHPILHTLFLTKDGHFFNGTLNPTLSPLHLNTQFIEADYELEVGAKRQIRIAGELSNESAYRYDFTVDRTPPRFNVVARNVTVSNVLLRLDLNISNEPHGVNGTIELNGTRHRLVGPLFKEENISTYAWNVTSMPERAEPYAVTVVLVDKAGNEGRVNISLVIDDVAPTVGNFRIDPVNRSLIVSNTLFLTSSRIINLSMQDLTPFGDVALVGTDGVRSRDGENLLFQQSVKEKDNRFTLYLALLGLQLEETNNSIVMEIVDQAGNSQFQYANITLDQRPPNPPRVKIWE